MRSLVISPAQKRFNGSTANGGGKHRRADLRPLRRGWCLGCEDFCRELLGWATERVGSSCYGSDRRDSPEQEAERLVGEELTRLGWDEEGLRQRHKGDKETAKVARRLGQETTMSL